MSTLATTQDVASSTDVDALWETFREANASGDEALASAARDRMAELQEQRKAAAMDDHQLTAHIRSLREMLHRGAPTPADGDDGFIGLEHGRARATRDRTIDLAGAEARRAELDRLMLEAQHRGLIV